jgi:hypothetical protein
VKTVIYDSGVLIAAEKRNEKIWRLHQQYLAAGTRPIVSVLVLAQVWRGGPQPRLSRLLNGCTMEDVNVMMARAIGIACAKSGTSDIVELQT